MVARIKQLARQSHKMEKNIMKGLLQAASKQKPISGRKLRLVYKI